MESGRNLANNDHKRNLYNNHIYDQRTPLRKLAHKEHNMF